MPTGVMKSFAEKSGKSVAEVEKIWDKAKAEAHDKFPTENEHFYAYVNATVQHILGLRKPTFKAFIKKSKNSVHFRWA